MKRELVHLILTPLTGEAETSRLACRSGVAVFSLFSSGHGVANDIKLVARVDSSSMTPPEDPVKPTYQSTMPFSMYSI